MALHHSLIHVQPPASDHSMLCRPPVSPWCSPINDSLTPLEVDGPYEVLDATTIGEEPAQPVVSTRAVFQSGCMGRVWRCLLRPRVCLPIWLHGQTCVLVSRLPGLLAGHNKGCQ
jgi:hypothetical protein